MKPLVRFFWIPLLAIVVACHPERSEGSPSVQRNPSVVSLLQDDSFLSTPSIFDESFRAQRHLDVLRKAGYKLSAESIKDAHYDKLGMLTFQMRLQHSDRYITYQFANLEPFALDGSVDDLLALLEENPQTEIRYLIFKRIVKHRVATDAQVRKIRAHGDVETDPTIKEEIARAINMIEHRNLFGEKRLNLAFLTYEADPLIKLGGLADVSGSLPRVLHNKRGHNATVFMPYWPIVDKEIRARGLKRVDEGIRFSMDGYWVQVYSVRIDGVKIYLLKCDDLFDVQRRPVWANGKVVWMDKAKDIYRTKVDEEYSRQNAGTDWQFNTHPLNAATAIFFSKAALAAMESIGNNEGWRPDIINTVDWQTGLVPALLKKSAVFKDKDFFKGAKTVHTIHNLAYKGMVRASPWSADAEERRLWAMTGLSEDVYSPEDLMGLEAWGNMSLMKAGIVFADQVTTVSPQYAEEILTPLFGTGFDGLFPALARKVIGILNAISRREWDFSLSKSVAVRAKDSPNDLEQELGLVDIPKGKLLNKEFVKRKWGLEKREGEKIPLFAFVGRFDDQKGLHLLLPVLEELLMQRKAQVIFAGSGTQYEGEIRRLHEQYPGNFSYPGYRDPKLGFLPPAQVQTLVAGADMVTMPSIFEPGGYVHLQAMRFGAIPIVNAVGGLKDAMIDFAQDPEKGNGYVMDFGKITSNLSAATINQSDQAKVMQELRDTIQRAVEDYRDTAKWEKQIRQVHRRSGDFNWDIAALQYEQLFRKLLYLPGSDLPYTDPPQILHAALAPPSSLEDVDIQLQAARAAREHTDAGRYMKFSMGSRSVNNTQLGKPFRDDSEILKTSALMEIKAKEIQYVLKTKYPKALKKPLVLHLVWPDPDSPPSVHPHTLALKEEKRNWQHVLALTRPVHGEAGNLLRREIFLPLELCKDPRATADMLARLIAVEAGVAKPPRTDPFRGILWENQEAVYVRKALENSQRYDAMEQAEGFSETFQRIQARGFPHKDVTKEMALAVVRRQVRLKANNLWKAYQAVRQDVQAGKIRLDDFPEALLTAQQMFYGIPDSEFSGKDRLNLNIFLQKGFPFPFTSYKDILVQAFGELDLNPVIFAMEGARRNRRDSVAAVHYKLALKASKSKGLPEDEIWPTYVAARDDWRSGRQSVEVPDKRARRLHEKVSSMKNAEFLRDILALPRDGVHDAFGASHIRGLVEPLPMLFLTHLSFRGKESERWGDRDDTTTYTLFQFARHVPTLWAKTISVRDAIRRGDLDPQDYPEDMVWAMSSYYARDQTEYTGYRVDSKEHLSLAKALNSTEAPYWEGHRSVMMRDILPEFPWTPGGFQEHRSRVNMEDVAQEIRYALAKEEQDLYDSIRALEDQATMKNLRVQDNPPNYVTTVNQLLRIAKREWIEEHVSKDVFKVGEGTKHKDRAYDEVMTDVFPLLELNPVALGVTGAWRKPDDAQRELQFRAALHWPLFWEQYRQMRDATGGAKLKRAQYNAQKVYVTEFLHLIRGPFMYAREIGFGTEKAMKDPKGLFQGRPLKVLRLGFPDAPVFGSEYYTGLQGIYDPDEDKQALEAYRRAKATPEGMQASLLALEDFHRFIWHLPMPYAGRKDVLTREKVLKQQKLQTLNLDPGEILRLKKFRKRLGSRDALEREALAALFAGRFLKSDQTEPHDAMRYLYGLSLVDPNYFNKVMQSAVFLPQEQQEPFLSGLRLFPRPENLPVLFLGKPAFQSWLSAALSLNAEEQARRENGNQARRKDTATPPAVAHAA